VDTAGDAVAVVLAATSAAAVVLLLWAVVTLRAAVRQLREAAAELRGEAIPAVVAARRTLEAADADLDRMDNLLGAAEAVSSTVEGATKLAYDTFSTPVIKAVALASGTGKAAKRLRQGGRPSGRRTG
jgi:hypothetical protein